MPDLFAVNAQIERPFRFADFDVKVLKRRLRKEAGKVQRQARRLISSQGVSQPGAMPGKQTGRMQKSVKTKVWRSGFGATIRPILSEGDYYPAFVVYGHRGPKTRTAEDNRKHRKTVGGKVAAPRANFMVTATEKVGVSNLQKAMAEAMDDALKPMGIL